jgi:short-subunit dehydrogenase
MRWSDLAGARFARGADGLPGAGGAETGELVQDSRERFRTALAEDLFESKWIVEKERRLVELRGRVVIITGAGGGIGLATAKAFAREGCRVAVCDRREDLLEGAREQIEGYAEERAGGVLAAVVDVSDEQQVRGFVEAVVERWGRVDVLVNNAGYGAHKPFLKMEAEEIHAQMGTNYMGAVHAAKAALEHMVPAGRGHIINVVSVVAKLPVPNSGAYAATKAALDSLSLTLRAELSESGVAVTAVYPTATRKTNFFKTSGSPAEQGIARIFMKEPTEVAEAVVGAAKRPRAEVHVGLQTRLLPVVRVLCPPLIRLALQWIARVYR